MEDRTFIPDIVEFLSARHNADVALIGSRAEGLRHPVTYDFLCLHDGDIRLDSQIQSGIEPPWDSPPVRKEGRHHTERFRSRGRPVQVMHHMEKDLSELVEGYLAGKMTEDRGGLVPRTAILRSLQKMHPLHDPQARLRVLKMKVREYPERLRRVELNLAQETLAGILAELEGRRECGDAPFLSVVVRSGSLALARGLFALNEEYYPGPRRILRHAEGFRIVPPGIVSDLHLLFSAADRAADLKGKLPALERQTRLFKELAEEALAAIPESPE
jgi:hypothetical protein